jgi:hypothetical protein
MEPTAFGPVVDTLERIPTIVVPLVREMPEALRRRRPRPGKWSAHEHACHLASVHPVFFERLDLMLEKEHPALRPFLPEQDDPEGLKLQGDLDEALDRFTRDRAELVRRFRALRPEDWDRTAEHGECTHYSIFILARHAALHDMLHAYRIEELVLKKNWE